MQFAVPPAVSVGVTLDIAGIQQILFDLIRSGGDSEERRSQRIEGSAYSIPTVSAWAVPVSFALFPCESERVSSKRIEMRARL